MPGPLLEALQRSQAFPDQKPELIEHLVQVRLQVEPELAQSRHPVSDPSLLILQPDIFRRIPLLLFLALADQPLRDVFEVALKLQDEHPFPLCFVLALLNRRP